MFQLTSDLNSVHRAYKVCHLNKLVHVQMCLHTQTQHEFPSANCYTLAVTLQTLSHRARNFSSRAPAC